MVAYSVTRGYTKPVQCRNAFIYRLLSNIALFEVFPFILSTVLLYVKKNLGSFAKVLSERFKML